MRLPKTAIAAFLLVLLQEQADARDWWHDSFVWDESTQACGSNDSITTYGPKSVELWEASCEISATTRLKGLEGVVLDLACEGLPGESPWKRRNVLLKLEDDRVASYPPFHILRRCSALKNVPLTAAQCPFNQRAYRSADIRTDQETYQTLEFVDGLADGTVRLTEVKAGKPVWAAEGHHVCSNGASICRVEFPLMLGGSLSLPFEIVDDESLLVIPTFRQSVFESEKYAVSNGKEYGGVVADLSEGFHPGESSLTIPHNVYRYYECLPSESKVAQ